MEEPAQHRAVNGLGVGVRMAGAVARADRTSKTPLPSPVPGRGGEGFEAGEETGRRRTLLPLTAGLDPHWHPAAGPTVRPASSTTPFRVTCRVHAQARRLRVPPWPTASVAKTAREWSMRTSRGSPQPVSFPASQV